MDPIETVLQEIEKAISAKLHYLAIVLALTLPDVCAALEQPSGESDDGLYRKWYKKHLKPKMGALQPSDCYSLRCGVVHQGRMGVKNQQFGRVIFTIPGASVRTHNCIVQMPLASDSALLFDSEAFCRDMIQAVRDWFAIAKGNPVVQANLPNLVQFRPHGFPPYFVGVPVIA